MNALDPFIPTAEAAFIAGLSDRQMNRLVDERLVPSSLLAQQGSTRLFARLTAAFARFYFDTDELLVANARREVLQELTQRLERLDSRHEGFALSALPAGMDWKVLRAGVQIDMLPFVSQAIGRARTIEDAQTLISVDDDVMGGAPCFAGTRVPIEIVLASLVQGVDAQRLHQSYSFLTDAHLAAAQVYAQVHPRRGRPRRFDVHPTLKRRSTRTVRPARA